MLILPALSESLQKKVHHGKSHAGTVSVIVYCNDGRRQPGEVYLENWNQKQRTRRALKALGIAWGLAVIGVLIPLVHLILVPSLLIAGPIAAYIVYQNESSVLGGISQCRQCLAPFEIVKSANHWPLKDVCSKCFANVTIEKKDKDIFGRVHA